MTLAARLAQQGGASVLLLEQEPRHTGEGSKALCMPRETLEIWERLGVAGAGGWRSGASSGTWGKPRYTGPELLSVELCRRAEEAFPALREHQPDRCGGRPSVGAPGRARRGSTCAGAMGCAGRRRMGGALRRGSMDCDGKAGVVLRVGYLRVDDGARSACAGAYRHGLPWPHPRRPLPHLRYPVPGALPERAAILLRSALESRTRRSASTRNRTGSGGSTGRFRPPGATIPRRSGANGGLDRRICAVIGGAGPPPSWSG